MLNLRRHFRQRIPNGLAVLAALTLATTSLLGTSAAPNSGNDVGRVVDSEAGADRVWVTGNASVEEAAPAPSRRNTGFRMSLFLFRHN